MSKFKKIKYIMFLLPRATRFLIPVNILLSLVTMVLEVISIAMLIPFMSALGGSQNLEQSQFGILFKYVDLDGGTISILIIACVVFFIKSIGLTCILWVQNYFSFKVLRELNEITLIAFTRTEYRKHQTSNSSKKIQIIVSEIAMFCGYIIQPLIILFTEAVVIIGLVLFLLYLHALETFSIIFVMSITYYIFMRSSRAVLFKLAVDRLQYEEIRLKTLQEILNSIKEIAITQSEQHFLFKFQASNNKAVFAARGSFFLQTVIKHWLEVIFLTSVLMSLLVMQYFNVENSGFLLTYGLIFVAFVRLGPSINKLIANVQNLRFGMPSVEKLFESLSSSFVSNSETNNNSILMANTMGHNKPQDLKIDKIKKIQVENIHFAFDNQCILAGVSFDVVRGEILGVFGPSGSGKSTLMDILMGFQEVKSGKIIINFEEKVFPEILAKGSFQYVSQNVFILDDDIYSNVAFGIEKDKIDKAKIDKLLIDLQLSEFISELEGENTRLLGEYGKTLSGGQKQRIGFARALYRQPSILFLDEPTSSLDKESKNAVIKAINDISGEIITIIITHDERLLSTFTKTFELK